MMIRQAAMQDLESVTDLALALWPDHDRTALRDEMAALLKDTNAALFLLTEGKAIGFAQCQLRNDYVEGTSSSPVGYLEGIYVAPECRRKGGARALLAACEAWARGKGCTEFAGDCELTNTQSQAFHQSMGFCEANRIVCYVKPL